MFIVKGPDPRERHGATVVYGTLASARDAALVAHANGPLSYVEYNDGIGTATVWAVTGVRLDGPQRILVGILQAVDLVQEEREREARLPACQCPPGAWPCQPWAPPAACSEHRGGPDHCDNCGHCRACHR